jgi:hypothetical protein
LLEDQYDAQTLDHCSARIQTHCVQTQFPHRAAQHPADDRVKHRCGLLHGKPEQERRSKPIQFIPYPTEDQARAALESGGIQAYFVIAPDYLETRRIDLMHLKKPGGNAIRQAYDFLQINLLSDRPADIAFRASYGTEVIVRSLDGNPRRRPHVWFDHAAADKLRFHLFDAHEFRIPDAGRG